MNEWEFTGDVNSWINEIINHTPRPPFHRSKIEQTGTGSRKRRDLTLLDKSKRVLITGEIKLPYQADGNSPYITKVVKDARKKARRAKARFFFTWNVNECVLWETEPADPSKLGQEYKSWHVTDVHNAAQLEHRATEDEIHLWLIKFLHEVGQLLEGTATIGRKPPDEKFIEALDSFLKMPIRFTYDELDQLCRKKRERIRIEKWMREDQGWTIYNDPEGIRENLERASRFACYALVNRLVFYEALLKKYRSRLNKLRVPDHIDTGENLWIHLEGFFKAAINVTGDYETVFGEEHRSIGNRIPFYSDEAVPQWRSLINEIHEFDFTKLDHEVIGSLFERLLSPEERHKYGQFYTRVEIVDLINSFCIRDGNEKVMDPACGGGTFLVRAYARMKTLMPNQPHGDILKNLFGVDIMNFATHLTTMNLAARHLEDNENYPQIVRSDFFDVQADKIFATLPRKATTVGSGKSQRREVVVPQLDAVIGNPPYIRQEEIPNARKPVYKEIVKKDASVSLSGRSDIHCYFWPHATTFLKEDGYLCLLTSSQWLDVEYGFKLQEWILNNFEIHAIFESMQEPWFVGARVATTVTILKRQSDEARRMENTVRFVQLRGPIRYILAHDGTVAGAVGAADEFRDEIMGLTENTVKRMYRARLVSQKELWDTGVKIGVTMGKTDGRYVGGKWGVHLRAPDIWFELIDKFPSGWTQFTQIAEIHRGVTSGKDSFFFPRDCTKECLSEIPDATEFKNTYGVPRAQVKSGIVKMVRCGEKYAEIKPIESRYLEPELHSLMEVDGFVALPENCARMILLIGERKSKIKGKYARAYIKWGETGWGESRGVHRGSTCASRQSEARDWYDLTGHKRGAIFWPMAQQYKHAVPLNRHNLICNHNLFDISVKNVDNSVLAGILNSSLVILSKHQYGRPVGVEGNLKTEVVDVNMMLVPNPEVASEAQREQVGDAFELLKQRKVLQLLPERRMRDMAFRRSGREKDLDALSNVSELDMPDRRELDEAVLEMMGVRSKKRRRELLDELYRYLRDFFEFTRQKEEKAIENKNLTRRRGRLRPDDVAAQIYEEVYVSESWLLTEYGRDILDTDKLFDTYDIPDEGEARPSSDMFAGNGLVFVKGKKQTTGHVKTRYKLQDDLVTLLAEEGNRGVHRVPYEEAECKRVLKEYAAFVERRNRKLLELVKDRTSDEDLQEKILSALKSLIQQ